MVLVNRWMSLVENMDQITFQPAMAKDLQSLSFPLHSHIAAYA